MSKKALLDRNVPNKIFKPTFRRGDPTVSFLKKPDNIDHTLSEFADTNIESSSSYRYGDKKSLVSTQQVRTDFSNFVNHTFFHSAVANVNESFDRIVNFYPFNGKNKDLEIFEDSLTGFEKYVLDNFPKNVGYLVFSGTQKGEAASLGTSISVNDSEGSTYSSISNVKSAKAVLDPKNNPFTVSFFCKLPTQVNDNQIIVQKKASLANNFTLALSSSASTQEAKIVFGITSGSQFSFVSGSIEKGKFVNVAAVYDPQGDEKTKLIIDDKVVSSSMNNVFNNLNFSAVDLTIGTGNQARINEKIFDQQQTFSGSLDEFRYYHDAKNLTEIKKNKFTSVYADDDLKLYFKFNEPSGSYSARKVVLDSSKSNLHSTIKNYLENHTRTTGSDNPVLNEQMSRNPVLFPDYKPVSNFNQLLLSSGSEYDKVNPNLITKLIPPHYFLEANNEDNFSEILGDIGNAFSDGSNNFPGKNLSELQSTTLLVKFLLTWAKFFDEVKIMNDAITSVQHTHYDDLESTPDVFLKRRARDLNIDLPNLFGSAELSQLIEGVNLTEEYANSAMTLNEVQNSIWRRIISDSSNMKMTKGTVDSIKSVFRSSGIEPDNILTFREYGGAQLKSLESSRENKIDVIGMLNFSGSKGQTISITDNEGYSTSRIPKIKSGFLSGSRTQIGVPKISGTFVNKTPILIHGVSNNENDGLFTSGSFTYEGLYRFLTTPKIPQSLIRIHTTGSTSPSNKESIISNLVASSNEETLNLFIKDSPTSSETKKLFLTGVNIFDEEPWHISFGRRAPHDIGKTQRSQYFLRAVKQENGEILEKYQVIKNFANESDSVFVNKSVQHNASGSFLVVGPQNFQNGSSGKFLNDSTGGVDTLAHSSSFSGLVTNSLFWSKFINEKEWLEHAKNNLSVGVIDPKINYNFEALASGSFERLIIQTNGKQATTASNTAGDIRLFDFSQNNLHFHGSNFESSKVVFRPTRVAFEELSALFDTNIAKDKVRIRSFKDADKVLNSNFAQVAPVYETIPSEEVVDDNRFSIDMSVFRGLNENIMSTFATFSALDDALGRPNAMFADRYVDLEDLRKIYFNNVIEKVDLGKFRTIFKWIDNAFTELVFSMVPRSTNFLGINFIYESHVLERNKMRYLFDEIYLKSLPRDPSRGNLLLSQFVGKIKKH
jgi:hypothetical protein